MLLNLHVKNLALIDEAEVEFGEGFNILTGETGAGKSIIIGSINLALGEKVPKEMLRDKQEAALVELVFCPQKETVLQKLREMEIEPEDGMVILSRKITPQRAIGRINGETVSVSRMKEAASLLIDIHGQHEHQSLLSRRKHLEILDAFAKEELKEKKTALLETYREYRRILEEWEHSRLDEEEQKRELSLLEYEIQEIRGAELKAGEDEELEAQFNRFSNGKKILEGVNAAYAAAGGDGDSASERIGRALRELSAVSQYDERIASFAGQMEEIENLLSDVNREMSGYLDSTEFDGEEFYRMEKRLDLLNHLKSKYGDSIEEILADCEKKEERVQTLKDYDRYLERLQASLRQTEEKLKQLCEEVSQIRKKKAEELTKAIRESLQELNFLDVQFTMEFDRTADYTPAGYDDPQFLISTNPGEALKPLGKIASGGELSRIMLAIKTVMADADDIETLIFDEIDSGISGRTAQMVSEKMNMLAKHRQLICITHLPQIAAMADTHFLIEKSVQEQITNSHIRRLSEEESVNELARMLGGVEITDTVYQNAREMREMAYMKK